MTFFVASPRFTAVLTVVSGECRVYDTFDRSVLATRSLPITQANGIMFVYPLSCSSTSHFSETYIAKSVREVLPTVGSTAEVYYVRNIL